MGVARLVSVPMPFNGSDLSEVDHEQSADTVYMAHLDYAPKKLTRASHTSWAIADVAFGPTIDAPTGLSATPTAPNTDSANSGDGYFPQADTYEATAVNDTTGQESRASNSDAATNDLTLARNYTTITWTAAADADRYHVYKAHNQSSFGYIGTTTSVTFTDDNIEPDTSIGPPTGENPFSGDGNYPSSVAFFEERLMFGRTKNNPNAIWGSKSGEYENFDISRPLQDDDALSFGIVGGTVNAVNAMVAVNDLIALTSDSIFRVSAGGTVYQASIALTPSQIVARRQIGRGSTRLKPIPIDTVVFYQPSTGAGIRTIGYDFQIDGYQSNDISIFSPHLFRDFSIVSWAFAQEPRACIWAVRSDGALLCFTWVQEQQVWGWTRCDTDGLVKSVCTVSEGGENRLYLVVQRTINGVTKTFIERMAAAFWDTIEEACYLDCAISPPTFDEPQSVIDGLWHLEGATVTALADGNLIEGLTVTNGTVTLPEAASTVTVGLPYDALIETLPLAIQVPGKGWIIGRRTTAATAVARVIDTRGLLAGPDENHLDEIRPRQDEAYGDPAALKTGDYNVDIQGTSGDEGAKVVLKGTPGLPFTISAVSYDTNFGG